jgi:hypothetical protein
MAHRAILIGLAVVTLSLTACFGAKIHFWQADEFTEFQRDWVYYRWEEPPVVDAHSDDGQVLETATSMVAFDRELRKQVDERLQALGYRVSASQARFEVDYRVGNEAVVGLAGPDPSARDAAERIFAGPNAEYEVSSKFYTHRTLGYHEISHLKLSLYDVASKRVVWESSASRLENDGQGDAQKMSNVIDRSVQKMLRDFPAMVR